MEFSILKKIREMKLWSGTNKNVMKNLFIIYIIFISFNLSFSQSQNDFSEIKEKESYRIYKALNNSQLEDYNLEADRIVKAFETYINHIMDENLSLKTRKQAINNALSLFLNESVSICDSTLVVMEDSKEKEYLITDYLEMLLKSNSENLKLEWIGINSKENFNSNTLIKKIEVEQIVSHKNKYLDGKIEQSSKIADTHFVLEERYLFGLLKSLVQRVVSTHDPKCHLGSSPLT